MIARPILRYHGGKWRIAPWIISQFPPHQVYVEPFAGAASVLLRKQPANVEVLNDLNGEIINVFRVLRDPAKADRLAEVLRATPCSSAEYSEAWLPHPDPVEQARRTIVRGHQGHGSTGVSGGKRTGWRRGVRGISRSVSSHEWSAVWELVADWCDRLRGVYIENDTAIACMQRWDRPEALHYVDPPYLFETRTSGAGDEGYAHEMTNEDHRALAACLRSLRGKVALSGYDSPLYAELFPDWTKTTRTAQADNGATRTECLWLNPAADPIGRQMTIAEGA